MKEYREYCGREFFKDKQTGYWLSRTSPRIRAHRWVWEYHYGEIPKGYHIHHIDDNKSNNEIKNLLMLTAYAHLKHHAKDPIKVQRMREMAEKYRPLTKEWHASEEGKTWHKLHALKNKFGNGPEFDYQCQQCNEKYKSKLIAEGRTRFCSNGCKSKWRRIAGLDDILIGCENCGTEFKKNKYAKTRFCGKSCMKLKYWSDK